MIRLLPTLPAVFPWPAAAAVAGAMSGSAYLAVLLAGLAAAAIIDHRTSRIPDAVTGGLLIFSFSAAVTGYPAALYEGSWAFAVACTGGAALAADWIYGAVSGRAVAGGGDLKLIVAIGAGLGPAGAAWAVIGAAGLVLAAEALRPGGPARKAEVRFGPHLAAAAAAVAFLAHFGALDLS